MKVNCSFFYFLLSLIFISQNLYSKRIISNRYTGMERFKDKHWLNQHSWFKIVPLKEILKENQNIMYKKVIDNIYFECPPFSIAPKFPNKGYFEELFILSIPNGRVQGESGHVFFNEKLPDEMARGDRFECLQGIPKIDSDKIQKISGRVAVIAQHGSNKNMANYYHWICEVLGRLALLEMAGVEYDWLYVGMSKKFMKETLGLWSIDFSKIIEPADEHFSIQADELILPSLVINTSCGHAHAGNFQHPVILEYVKNKLLVGAKKENINLKFSKRVFISRKDAYNARRILNEDQIFDLFKAKGFERYEMSKLSVSEQILLCSQAEMVASEQGSGLTNILFCNPNTIIIEIFQALVDNCFWWLGQALSLNYIPIKTIPVDVDYFAHFRDKSFMLSYQAFLSQASVPLNEIQKIVAEL